MGPRKRFLPTRGSPAGYPARRTNKHKTHKHFSDQPCGTIVPGTNPHPFQGQTGRKGDFTEELDRKRPVCPRDGSQFVPGTGPICPSDGPVCARHRPAQPVYVYWFFYCLIIVAKSPQVKTPFSGIPTSRDWHLQFAIFATAEILA